MIWMYSKTNVFCDKCDHFPHAGPCRFGSAYGRGDILCDCAHDETSKRGLKMLNELTEPVKIRPRTRIRNGRYA